MLKTLHKLYCGLIPGESRLKFYKFRHPEKYSRLRKEVYPSPKGDFSLKAFDHKHTIFVHITKTAGTSVARSLFNYLPYHYAATEYRVIYGKRDFNDYFKFAFVRNPWDRLYSAYRYLKSGGWNETDKKWAKANLAGFNSFNHFVVEWLTLDNIKKHLHFRPQYEFVCDKHGKLIVDYIAYFETIDQDYEFISKKLNITTKLAKHNVNPGKNYTAVYSDEAKIVVEKVYRADIKLFGYNFEGVQTRCVQPSSLI